MREIMYLKMQEEEQSTVGGGETPALPRHLLPCTTSDCTLSSTETNTETAKDSLHILVGCVYEIDHNKLPPRSHGQLRSARVVVVSEKTESNISVRFPSTQSLQSYLSSGITELSPELDERFVMGARLAEKMLIRQVPSQEFVERRSSKDFWQLISNSDCGIGYFVISDKAGSCLPELKCNGMVRWGVHHQVKFVKRRAETTEGDQEESKEENDEETYESEQNDERKRCSSRLVPKGKKAKLEKQSQINKTRKNNCKQIGRWSAERYKVAEKILLKVMKAKGATNYKSPILRAEVRLETRKRIGDTGLLDHLLKHMAGKVAPGGAERFRRRHNAEGAMEYWLESADLVDVNRREAGVRDPYWNPPPDWKSSTGDCPSQQDPICAKEMKELKEETSKLERDLEELASKKHMGEEIAKLRMEIEEELSKKQQRESQETVPLNPMITLEKYMEEVMGASRYVSRIEEEIGKLKSKVRVNSNSALMVSTESCDDNEKKKVGKPLKVPQQKEAVETGGRGDHGKTDITDKEVVESTGAGVEEKAAKIQRLKSGFRICKPQGTFLWPNMADVVHAEDVLVVPNPPSVSSSTAAAPPKLPYHHHHLRPYPIKPLAGRQALRVTASSIGDKNISSNTPLTARTTGTNKTITSLMNLNGFPSQTGDRFCGTRFSSSPSASSCLPKKVGTWLALASRTSASSQ